MGEMSSTIWYILNVKYWAMEPSRYLKDIWRLFLVLSAPHAALGTTDE